MSRVGYDRGYSSVVEHLTAEIDNILETMKYINAMVKTYMFLRITDLKIKKYSCHF